MRKFNRCWWLVQFAILILNLGSPKALPAYEALLEDFLWDLAGRRLLTFAFWGCCRRFAWWNAVTSSAERIADNPPKLEIIILSRTSIGLANVAPGG